MRNITGVQTLYRLIPLSMIITVHVASEQVIVAHVYTQNADVSLQPTGACMSAKKYLHFWLFCQ